MVTVLIAGGGTGGHVFPMLAVGDAVRKIEPSARVVYAGTPRGIEGRVLRERGDEIHLLDVAPLRGDGLRGLVKGVTRAASALPLARSLVQKVVPDVALSVGGYASGPIALAARFHGVPVALLEPNSVLGLSNRLLTPFVERAYVAFPDAMRFLRPGIVRVVGVPLRGTFSPAPYQLHTGSTAVLVLGGSQGAQGINEAVPRAIAGALAAGADLRVVHQTGRDRADGVRALYAVLGLSECVRVVPFLDDVASELAAADLVIGRSGASSLAELCAVGRPAILIPFPHAADNHQYRNAISIERAGAAVAIEQTDATPARLTAEIMRLAKDGGLRLTMARAAVALGKPDAARMVAEDLLALGASKGAKSSSAHPREPS